MTSRRRLVIAFAPLLLLGIATSCAGRKKQAGADRPDASAGLRLRHEFVIPWEAGDVRVVVYCAEEDGVLRAERAALDRFATFRKTFDATLPESEVSQVHANAGLGAVRVSDELYQLLRQSERLSERSDGAVEPTAGAYEELWRIASAEGRLPTEEELAEADARVGPQKLRLDPIGRTAHLTEPRARLDLSPYLRGLACDTVLAALDDAGFPVALVDAGRRIALGDAPPGTKGWPIRVTNAARKSPERTLTLRRQAIASSSALGDVVVIDGEPYAPVMDPRTAIGARNLAPATAVARRGWQADSLARAAAVLGERRGRKLARSLRDARVWFHYPPGTSREEFEEEAEPEQDESPTEAVDIESALEKAVEERRRERDADAARQIDPGVIRNETPPPAGPRQMKNIELLIGLLVAVAALAWLASRLRVAYPILLVLGGLGIAMVPGLPTVQLDPDLVFLLFLPPLLYYAALLTSWRDFKSNLRPISLLAVGLVLFTTCLVAVTAHWAIGLGWATAFTLGAIVSPPDAVAATAVTQRLRVPRRVVAILEGESLVNDATALVIYRVAIAVAVGRETFSLGGVGLRFLWIAAAGVGIGYLAGMLVAWVRPRIKDPAVEGTVSLLTPFIAYLPAEWLHVSGVLAVVTAGIYLSRRLPQVVSARSRLRAYAMWETLVFILNGFIFILIGLHLRTVLQALAGTPAPTLVYYAVLVSLVAIVARIGWVFFTTSARRLLGDPLRAWIGTWTGTAPARPRSAPPNDWGTASVIAWTGMRGIVSLAAALALPNGSDGNPPFPHRDLILFVTFGVILATLVLQGLTLPAIIRRLRLPPEVDAEDEETTARYLGALAGVERLDQLAAAGGGHASAVARLRAEYDERIQFYVSRLAHAPPDASQADVSQADAAGGAAAADGNDAMAAFCSVRENVRRQTIAAERAMLTRLRDTAVIGDEVHRRIQEDLDLEESRLNE